jgi:sulfite reductase (NADPH) flavoprotein alpha-component
VTERYIAAACITLLWLGVCLQAWFAHRRHMRQDGTLSVSASALTQAASSQVIVAYASQTGFAEEIATRTQQSLLAAGTPALLLPLARVDAALLALPARILFVVSTTGEGDAPDAAAPFISQVMAQPRQGQPAQPGPFAQLRYAMLALGDSSYTHFCRFGRSLDDWLQQHGAAPLFDRVDMDDGAAQALRDWQGRLGRWFQLALPDAWASAGHDDWVLTHRALLNPGNPQAPCFHLVLRPPAGVGCQWQAGDIAEIQIPGVQADQALREYSIASLPAEGAIHLLVRQVRLPDGSLGQGSGWLTAAASLGQAVPLRVRSNRNFHAPAPERGLILIGNGTGLAGLRAHIKARSNAGLRENWLIFGERMQAHDYHFREEIEVWRADGTLQRLDLAFSRDHTERVYVQHRLRESASELRAWVARGAAIYVCGSLNGMAGDVHRALGDILGPALLQDLMETGRYRRDVY